MKNTIFISYSKKDREFAHKFADDLIAAGHKVWIDRSLQVGDDWEKTIEAALENAQEVIVVLSQNSIHSKWVQHEGSIAYGLKKTIFPVLLDALNPEDLPIWTAKFQYHNFVGVEYQKAFDVLNAILTPPNPIQDLLDQQVNAFRQTGALMSDAVLGVIEEAQDNLDINKDAENLIQTSLKKREEELSEREKQHQREMNQNKRLRQFTNWLTGLLVVVLILLGVAFRQNKISKANNIVAHAFRENDNHNYQLAALLGLEANNIYETEEANNLLSQIPYFETPFPIVLQSFSYRINSMAWSKDGQLAVSFRGNSLVVIWDSETNELRQLRGHEGGVNSVAWSPDGQLVSGGGYDKAVIVWDLKTDKPNQILHGHQSSVSDLAWSIDGRLASGGRDGLVIIWDLQNGEPYKTLQIPNSRVNSVAWSDDGRLASGGENGALVVWNLITSQPEYVLNGHGENDILSVAWSKEGQLASAARGRIGGDGDIIVWDLRKGEPYKFLRVPNGSASSVAWSADGQLASNGGGLILWDIETGQPKYILQSPTGNITDVTWTTDGQLTSASDSAIGEDGRDINAVVVAWDFETGEQYQILEGHRGIVTDVAVSMNGQLASSGSDGTVIVWDLETGEPSQVLQGHKSSDVKSVSWSQDGRLASGGYDGSVIVWDLETGEPSQVLRGHEWKVNSVAWSVGGQLASGGLDGSVIVWDLESGLPSQTFQNAHNYAATVAWSVDGLLTSAGYQDDKIIFWDLESGEPFQTLDGRGDVIISWSQDGQLASTTYGDVIVWDLVHEEPYQTLDKVSAYDLAWSKDGLLASIGGKNVVVWDLASGSPYQILGSSGYSIAWLPDKSLVVGEKDGLIRIVPERYLHPICEWVGRNLTKDEWEWYVDDLFYRRTCSNLPWPYLSFNDELTTYIHQASFVGKVKFLLAVIIGVIIVVVFVGLVFFSFYKLGRFVVLRLRRDRK